MVAASFYSFFESLPIPNSKGIPVYGDAKYTGVGKFRNFRLKSPSDTVQNRPMVTIER